MTTHAPRAPWLALACGILALALSAPVGCGGRPEDESGSSGTGPSSPPPSAFAGSYEGTFQGGDAGSFVFTVDEAGDLTGSGTSTAFGAFTLSGSVADDGSFTATTDTGATWEGTIDDMGDVLGTWTQSAISGTLSASRV